MLIVVCFLMDLTCSGSNSVALFMESKFGKVTLILRNLFFWLGIWHKNWHSIWKKRKIFVAFVVQNLVENYKFSPEHRQMVLQRPSPPYISVDSAPSLSVWLLHQHVVNKALGALNKHSYITSGVVLFKLILKERS